MGGSRGDARRTEAWTLTPEVPTQSVTQDLKVGNSAAVKSRPSVSMALWLHVTRFQPNRPASVVGFTTSRKSVSSAWASVASLLWVEHNTL